MNGVMTINVRVIGRQAVAQLQSVTRGVSGVGTAAGRTNASTAGFLGFMDALSGSRMARASRNLSFIGRQLTYGVTLPFSLAAVSLTKANLNIERSMTRVAKVYGDASYSIQRVDAEVAALGKSFELLSTRFGVAREEVIEIAGDFAAAGSAGVGLAKMTRQALEVMILGEIDAATAAEQLIAVQAQWGLSTDELRLAIAQLNVVENETGIQMAGLLEVFTRTSGVWRQGGGSIRELAAAAAALTPAAGSAAQAGNSLKTMVSRLVAPTQDTIDVLAKMGITVASDEWLGATITEKLRMMAERFGDLSTANQNLVSSVVASRWQVNRFTVLMDALNSEQSYYQRALQATASDTDTLRTYTDELNTVLSSNPRKFDIMTQAIRNQLANAMLPMLPVIMSIMKAITNLATAFSEMDPQTQKWIILGIAFLAMLGPIMQIISAIMLMGSLMRAVSVAMASLVTKLIIPALGLVLKAVLLMVHAVAQAVVAAFTTTASGTAAATASTTSGVYGMSFAATRSMASTGTAAVAVIGGVATASAGAATATSGIWLTNVRVISTAMATTTAQYMAMMGMLGAGSVAALQPAMLALGTGVPTAAISAAGSMSVIPAAAAAASSASTGFILTNVRVMEASAATTAGIWARTFAWIRTAFLTYLVQPVMVGLTALAGALGLPIWAVVAIIAAVIAAIILILRTDLEDSVWDVIQSIARAFAALPQVIADVFRSIINVIGRAMEYVRDALSYLNPFARHSPSLVDQVRAGVNTIIGEYARFRALPGIIRNAIQSLNAFGAAASPTGRSLRSQQLANLQNDVAKINPVAGRHAGGVVDQILQLEAQLPGLTQEIANQSLVVARWEESFDAAAESVEQAQAALRATEDALTLVGDQMAAAQARIDELANMPLEGMGRMEDQIFANQQAQDKLNLALLEFERRGESIDKIREKYAALNGELELVQGERNALRLAGAGSDVLKMYDDQIVAIKQQKGSLTESEKKLQDINAQLEALDLEGRFLRLTQSITFDPLVYEIQKLVKGSKEVTFDEAIAGIRQQQSLLRELQPQYDALVAQQKAQNDAVRQAESARDALGDQLDAERQKLGVLEEAYSSINSLIREMESSLSDFVSLWESLQPAAVADQSLVQELFDAGLGQDYDIQGGEYTLQPEGNLFDIEAWNKQMEADLAEALGEIGNIDFAFPEIPGIWETITAPFRRAIGWIRDNWAVLLLGVVLGAVALLGAPLAAAIGAILAGLVYVFVRWGRPIWDWTYKYIVSPVLDAVKWLGGLLKGVWDSYIFPVFETIIGFFKDVFVAHWNLQWEIISTAVELAWAAIQVVWDAMLVALGFLVTAWDVGFAAMRWAIESVSGIMTAIWGQVAAAFSWVWESILKPVFDAIVEVLDGYVRPMFELVAAVVEIVAVLIARAIEGMWKILSDIFTTIVGFLNRDFRAAWEFMGQVVGAVWRGILNAISWMWGGIRAVLDAIIIFLAVVFGGAWIVLSTVVREVWGAISHAAQSAWDFVIKPVFVTIASWIENVLGPVWRGLSSLVGDVMGAIGGAIQWAWDNLIKPVFNSIVSFLDTVLGGAFNGFLSLVRAIWGGVLFAIGWVWDKIASVIEGGLNFFIKAFNTIAGVVNAIGDVLSIDVNVPTMDEIKIARIPYGDAIPEAPGAAGGGGRGGNLRHMASGGIVPLEGDVVAGARAIVGEGSKVWPEFVVPTDPRYRGRARKLYAELGPRLGAQIPGLEEAALMGTHKEIGGIIGGIGDAFSSGVNFVKSAGKWLQEQLLEGLWAGPKAIAQGMINQIGTPFIRGAGHGVIDTIDEWIDGIHTGSNDIKGKFISDMMPKTGAAGSWKVIPELLNKIGVPYKILSTFRPGSMTRFTDRISWHAHDRAIDLAGPQWMSHPQMLAINHAIYDAYKPILHELIYGGPGARNVFDGRDHQYRTDLLREHVNHVHASLATGGRVRIPRTHGGVLVRVAEGNRDEELQVRPIRGGGSGDGGGNTYHFYGDLSFPNITRGDEAQRFLANLESIAGSNS